MTNDSLVVAARDLLGRGLDAFSGPHADAFVDEVSRQHPAGNLYRWATAKAVAGQQVPTDSPDKVAAGVYTNYIWSHFVCKLVMTTAPRAALEYARTLFDISELQSAIDSGGPALLSSFHYTGFPLMALDLAQSPVAPLFSKGRVDLLEKSSAPIGDHVVYLSDRSAGVRLTRALRQGRSIFIMLDVMLSSTRVVRTQFLGLGMGVAAGLGKIARLSGRPCVPLFWELTDQGARLRTGPAVHPVPTKSEEELIQDFVDSQAAFVAQHTAHWLEWYSVLDGAPGIRGEIKRGNEALWARLVQALE
jgi:lauroyl/myristoyl acyltransferase